MKQYIGYYGSILDRHTDGRMPPPVQSVGVKPGALLGIVSGELGLGQFSERERHTFWGTSDNEALAETTSDEGSKTPIKKLRTTAVPLDSVARAIIAFLCLCLLSLSSCTPVKPVPRPLGPGQITQISVINALMIGRYDGVMPIPELLRHGDFGVGTLDHLDGELIVLGGHAYQVRGDGAVVEVGPDRSTPFAIVTSFEQDGEFFCRRVASLTDLDGRLDDAMRQKNNFLSVRVDGQFDSITLRSVHRQEPPYKPLGDVVKGQSIWTHGEVNGTLVGVRCPEWVGGLNVPGYHWHFLSDDRKVGGHVLDCRVREGRVRYDVCRDWLVKLDGSNEFNGANLTEDLRRDLKRVEGSRGEGSQGGVPGR